MTSTLELVIENIIHQISQDGDVQALLTTGPGDVYPVFHARTQKKDVYPRITVMDVAVNTEISGLGDGYDGSKSYDWNTSFIQVDVYSSRDPTERDRLYEAAKKCLLKTAVKASLKTVGLVDIHSPRTLNLDRLDGKPPEFRKALTYTAFWVGEA